MKVEVNSRKFLGFVTSMTLITVTLFLGKITGGQFITGLLGTLGAYYAANVGEKATLLK